MAKNKFNKKKKLGKWEQKKKCSGQTKDKRKNIIWKRGDYYDSVQNRFRR